MNQLYKNQLFTYLLLKLGLNPQVIVIVMLLL